MANAEEWSTNANDAVEISLLQPGAQEVEATHQFHPKFTYPIFGEEESIFGYRGLEIDLKFAAHDLQPNVSISYEKKFTPIGSTVALDLVKTLKEFLPESAFSSSEEFENRTQNEAEAKDFKPPGELVTSYDRNGRTFEIWAGSLLDPAVRKIIDRIQIFILMFIEAGTYINTDDVDWTLDRWRIYFVYEVTGAAVPTASPYVLAGYASTYRFYSFQSTPKATSQTAEFPALQEITPSQLPARLRISQFLILPPFQSAGHGSAMYQAIYSQVMADATITELTIEDPSEECDKLRDINDWKVLEPKFRAANIKINTAPYASSAKSKGNLLPTARLLPIDTLKAIRSSTKIASRQFARQLEMYLLSLIPQSHRASGGANLTKLMIQKSKTADLNDKAYYWWRLIVKQRITKINKDKLQQVDLVDRIPYVDETARAQEDEYEGLLLYMLAMEAKEIMKNSNGERSAAPRKRKIVDDNESDDDDEMSREDTPSDAKKSRQ